MGLAAVINTQPDMAVVAEATTGKQAIELFREHRPDVTLMDLRMPEMEGIEAITIIRQEFPEGRFIVLTTYDGDEDIYRALQAGARAYLLKDMLRDGLVEAIRAVHAGQRRIPAEVANRLAERMNRTELTARELEVLRLIVLGRSNKQIASQLTIAEGTVKIHINNILSKLGVSDRTQAATFALQRGIVHLD
ncbi:MAG TPA: response regulator transcription factor [Blastocatellia bacterium]|nr:response regulator transcription factor [Blastocatellia bacterium]